MTGRSTTALLMTLALVLLGACSPEPTAEKPRRGSPTALSGTLRITGSSTMQPLMAEVAKSFQSLHPGVRIEVQSGGSGRGITDARTGKADIGMASRALTDKESDLFGFAVGRDGICLLVHAANPVKALTRQQIVAIYTGRVVNWKEAGGDARDDTPILVMGDEESRSSHELFIQYLNLRNDEIKLQMVLGDNPLRVKAIAENPNAIVYISLGEAERRAEEGAPIKLLSMEGVPATSRNIRNGNYPIYRPLTLVTRELPKGIVKVFIEFALSSQVNDIVAQFDFIPYDE